jgi:membrane protease YdiL (CAAX protease family)
MMGNSGTPFDNEPRPEPSPADGAQLSSSATPGLFAEAIPAPAPRPEPYAHLPQDLRVPWTWLDLLLFFFFAIGCLFITARVFIVLAAVVVGVQRGTGDGQFAIPASWNVLLQLIWYGVLVAYLFLLVRIRFKAPFWHTVGFRAMTGGGIRGSVGAYAAFAFTGMLLAIMISALSALVRPVGEIPMERLFQQRESAALVLFAAVVVAPVVEELLFRGWLYPVVARTFGVACGVLITGALFGLMHGAQLGWHTGLVALLTLAGVVFTYFRARTGSVLPSYFLHLGYNSIPVIGFLLQTSGLRNLPTPGP